MEKLLKKPHHSPLLATELATERLTERLTERVGATLLPAVIVRHQRDARLILSVWHRFDFGRLSKFEGRSLLGALLLAVFIQGSAFAASVESSQQLETYQDLVLKAQNLTLQQDRLQTSQVLIRGLQHETRGSAGYKELQRSLDDLTSVFYTEKAQSLFATAEASFEARPREAIDQLTEALKSEDRNLSILKELARAHLKLDECDKADGRVKTCEEVDPYSAEVKLLRLQVLFCQKNFEALTAKFASKDPDLEPVEKYARSLQAALMFRDPTVIEKDPKKAKAFISTWEVSGGEDPEVFYWKWELSKILGDSDRLTAVKYTQRCQNLTPRKKKALSLDVNLCKAKDTVEKELKDPATRTHASEESHP